jgi:hypothetical protein
MWRKPTLSIANNVKWKRITRQNFAIPENNTIGFELVSASLDVCPAALT